MGRAGRQDRVACNWRSVPIEANAAKEFALWRISDHIKLVELHAEQQEAQDRITTLYARWEELEEKAG